MTISTSHGNLISVWIYGMNKSINQSINLCPFFADPLCQLEVVTVCFFMLCSSFVVVFGREFEVNEWPWH
jgi:hypothetical protein